jgi:hypothetical protein
MVIAPLVAEELCHCKEQRETTIIIVDMVAIVGSI